MRRSNPPRFGFSSVPGEDPYADLLSRTRDLRQEQRHARDVWFQQLELPGKEDVLFELEVLLKAAACFANPRNHPGPPRRAPVVAQDFKEAASLFRDGLHSVITLARGLLGPRDRAYSFHRYLETVLPQDSVRTRLAREGFEQSTPEQSLLTLRHGLTTTIEVIEGALRTQRIPFRLFYALLTTVQREVGRNEYFNPLNALEFRPEFDRIKSAQVLELIRAVPGREAHRLVALTFLSLFRMLRYVKLLERQPGEPIAQRRYLGSTYLILSVLRSDARALADFLRQNAGRLLAEGFERDLLRVPASEIRARSNALTASARAALAVRTALAGIAESLRMEMRRSFQHDLASWEPPTAEPAFQASLTAALDNLRPALRRAVLYLAKSLGATLNPIAVFEDPRAAQESSDRLRRDVWMFAQILRAFATKAQHSRLQDTWPAAPRLRYVREFLGYYRSIGSAVVELTEYPRREHLAVALTALGQSDLLDAQRLRQAVSECLSLQAFLMDYVDDLSRSPALKEWPFDRRRAAATLKLYLGD